ncbi:MAG: hypothetical protein M1834_007029 [Cirrosporium novae-zelandiae]|nr:MAG: hypothetical protein M1834_007029 [Cirrosporium novae-zelandiae]
MDFGESSNSNKVTIEYTDPSNIFPIVQESLATRLPLQNLHWKSPSRPLRSIDRLDVEFVSDQRQPASTDPDGGSTTSANPKRRHQIPGLRQTPYVKVYLLRCDDNDTYKSTCRKLVREWVKKHAAPKSTTATSQENHDAYDWLILHVIFPPSATGPQSIKKWGADAASVVHEKIRTEFNGSSKSAIDRVAKIILPRSEEVAIPPPPDAETSWEDFVSKLKTFILSSFDLRVGQYEEDIREKDLQRSLPGWNFCTFFILKEGLARGFESMGLVEDALVGYDELAHGFELYVSEEAGNTESQHAGTFLSFTKSLQEEAKAGVEQVLNQGESENNLDGQSGDTDIQPCPPEARPISSDKKPYRELILANDISLAANVDCNPTPSTSNNVAGNTQNTRPVDLRVLAELCQRAAGFTTLTARTLRRELESSLEEKEITDNTTSWAKQQVIDNMISSWTFAVSLQVLQQTEVSALVLPSLPSEEPRLSIKTKVLSNLSENSGSAQESPRIIPPPRLSSLFHRSVSDRELDEPTSPNILTAKSPSHQPSETLKTGEEELAAFRAHLFLISYRIIGRCGKPRGWLTEFTSLIIPALDGNASGGDFQDVGLDDEDPKAEESNEKHMKDIPSSIGIECSTLKLALKNKEDYFPLAESTVVQALRHFLKARRTKSAKRMLTHLGVLKYAQGRYQSAASYFHQAALSYSEGGWIFPENYILERYAACMKQLGRTDDYVRISLKAIAKRSPQSIRAKNKSDSTSFQDQPQDTLLADVISCSKDLTTEITVRLLDYFTDIKIDRYPQHHDHQDGLAVGIKLHSLVPQILEFDEARLQLVGTNETSDREIWFENKSKFKLGPRSTKLLVTSTTSVSGLFAARRLILKAGKVTLTCDLAPGVGSLLSPGADVANIPEKFLVFCFPAADALDAEFSLTKSINLGKPRVVEIELTTGWNHVSSGEIRVRPKTAGLRLRVADATLVEGQVSIRSLGRPGIIEFGELGAEKTVRFAIPYTLETDHSDISLKIEVAYTTEKGEFLFISNPSLNIILPLGVNVQDVFKERALFSRFTISCASPVPLRVFGCEMSGDGPIVATPAHPTSGALDVYPRQPVFLLYRFTANAEMPSPEPNPKNVLALTIVFECLDEVICSNVRKKFEGALAASPFRHLTRLLVPNMLSMLQSRIGGSNFEVVSLLRELDLGPFDEVSWNDCLRSVPPKLRPTLNNWLSDWHKTNQSMTLLDSDPKDARSTRREVIIPVDIPEVEFVQTVEMCIHSKDKISPASVGCTITADLKIRCQRKWHPSSQTNTQESWRFIYELQNNPDTWLVGGRRRASFVIREHETHTIPVVLIPQRPGYLLLPGVDIQATIERDRNLRDSLASPRDSTGVVDFAFADKSATASPTPAPTIPCEVDYRNNGETILVLPDLKSTTVSIDPDSFAAGWRLTGSESRTNNHVG